MEIPKGRVEPTRLWRVLAAGSHPHMPLSNEMRFVPCTSATTTGQSSTETDLPQLGTDHGHVDVNALAGHGWVVVVDIHVERKPPGQ